MQNKLQELTDKLYNEGLSKGKQEAEQILGKAKAESGKIVADARTEAERIIAEAAKEAQELKIKTENDIKMASVQSFSAIRQEIENAIILKTLSGPVDAAVNDNDFIWENQGKVVSAINSSMGKVSGDLKQPFREGDVYWTSSPAMPTEACFIYFDDGGSVFVLRSLKNSSNSVRPVLGFGSF